MQEYAIPSGISDTARLNKNYTEIINELSVSEVSNQEALRKYFTPRKIMNLIIIMQN